MDRTIVRRRRLVASAAFLARLVAAPAVARQAAGHRPDMLRFDNGVDLRDSDPLKPWLAAYSDERAAEWGQTVSIGAKKAAFAPGGSNLRTSCHRLTSGPEW